MGVGVARYRWLINFKHVIDDDFLILAQLLLGLLTADSLRGGSNNPFARSPKKNHHPSSSAHIGWCAVEGTSVAPTDSPRLEWVEYI